MNKYHFIMMFMIALGTLGYAQSVQAQEVLESFPLDLSTCKKVVVSAHFDHSGKDYHCGTNRYSSHKGTDFAPSGGTPCTVVAAAPGEVVTAVDGLFDANKSSKSSENSCCANGSGCSYGNHVKVKQEDGTYVVYAHMKKGSVKVKKGDILTCGQPLGVQASSGCSTGTHLHFDISTNSKSGNRFDPYHGECNDLKSRWVSQGDYAPKGVMNLPAATCQCKPNCDGKQCGNDGCDGSCGECAENQVCSESAVCECVPQCEGKQCGDNGCGGKCGECAENQACSESGICECVPQCDRKECGDDGCGGKCGECAENQTCSEAGICECVPQCSNKECGDDGCGGKCGECTEHQTCSQEGICECVPQCSNKECGDDGCGGECGKCDKDMTCTKGKCECVNCNNDESGDDTETNEDKPVKTASADSSCSVSSHRTSHFPAWLSIAGLLGFIAMRRRRSTNQN